MEQRFWLACYDVRNDKRLRRVARIMQRYGNRIQKSVFECWLTEKTFAEMTGEVEKTMDKKNDSLRLYTLCEPCRNLCESQGKTPIQEVKQFYIV